MNKLVECIENLLYDHDVVVVPQLGAFIGHFKPSYIENGIIYPACKQIEFNPNQTEDNGLLAGLLNTEQVSQVVAQIKEQLEAGEHVEWGSIGTTFRNEQGNIVFEPNHHNSFVSKNFGLKPVTAFSPLHREEENLIEPTPASTEEIIPPVVVEEIIPKEKPVVKKKEVVPQKKAAPQEKNRSLFWIFTIIIIIALLVFGTYKAKDMELFNKTHINSTPKAPGITADTTPISSQGVSSQTAVDSSTKSDTPSTISAPITSTKTIPKVQSKSPYRYLIIVGSAPTREEAISLRSRLKKKGFTDIILNQEAEDLFRLSAGTFDNKDDATIALQKYASIKGVWIVRKRN